MVNWWFGIRIGVPLSNNRFQIAGNQTISHSKHDTRKLMVGRWRKFNIFNMSPEAEVFPWLSHRPYSHRPEFSLNQALPFTLISSGVFVDVGKITSKILGGWNLGSDAVGLAWFGDQCVSWFSWDRGCYQVVYRRLFQAIRRTLSKPTAWNQKDSQEGERTPCMFLGSVFLLGDVCHPMLYNANRSVWSKVWYHQERLLRLREARASSQWFSRREKNINTINYSIN